MKKIDTGSIPTELKKIYTTPFGQFYIDINIGAPPKYPKEFFSVFRVDPFGDERVFNSNSYPDCVKNIKARELYT